MHTCNQPGKQDKINRTHCLIGDDRMDLCTKHDAGEEREEKSLKNSKNHGDKDQRCGKNGITACCEEGKNSKEMHPMSLCVHKMNTDLPNLYKD